MDKEKFLIDYPDFQNCFKLMSSEKLLFASEAIQEEIKKRKLIRFEEAVNRLVEELNHFKKEFPFAELNINCYCNCGDFFPINVLECFNSFKKEDFSIGY